MAAQFKNISKFTIYSNYSGELSLMGSRAFSNIMIFQSMFDDTVRGSFVMNDTGYRDSKREEVNIDEIDGFNLTSGEKVELKLEDTKGNILDFKDANEFLIEDVKSSGSTTMYETFNITLCQDDFVRKEFNKHKVIKHWDGSYKISEIVNDVLKNILQTKKNVFIDPTANKLPINGHYDDACDFCTLLASKAVSEQFPDFSGYFFFDTYEGYKFKSIDVMFSQEPKRIMLYNETQGAPNGKYTNKILESHFNHNLNVIDNIRSGSISKTILKTWDPYTHAYTETEYDANELYKTNNNAEVERPKVGTHLNIAEESSNTLNHVWNTGTKPTGTGTEEQIKNSKEPTFDIENIVRKSIMRTKQAMLYKGTITIAGDFGIFPGDVIQCDFPEVSSKDLNKVVSKKKSGKYLVLDVAHLISGEHCYTKLNIIRDSIKAA